MPMAHEKRLMNKDDARRRAAHEAISTGTYTFQVFAGEPEVCEIAAHGHSPTKPN